MSLCWLILYKYEQMKLIVYKPTVAIAFFYFSSKMLAETLAANICIKYLFQLKICRDHIPLWPNQNKTLSLLSEQD